MLLEGDDFGSGEATKAVALRYLFRVGGTAIYLSWHVFDGISTTERMQWHFWPMTNGTEAANWRFFS